MFSFLLPGEMAGGLNLAKAYLGRKRSFHLYAPLLFIGLLGATPLRAQLSAYWNDFDTATLQPETLLTPAYTAAFSNYVIEPAGFGGGGTGLGYHYGVSLADNVQGKFFRKFAFAAASRREDTYYFLGDRPSIGKRIGNVLLHSILSVPQCSHQLNWSGVPASLVSAAFSNIYEPDAQRTLSATMTRFGTNSAGYVLSDVLSEFKFSHRKQPGHAIRVVLNVSIGKR
jgi:hypothetical protein